MVVVLASISVAAHFLFLLWLRYVDRSDGHLPVVAAVVMEEDSEPALDPSCVADETMAYGVALAYCATPFAGERDVCTTQAAADFRIGLLACRQIDPMAFADADPVEVALVEQKFLDKIKPEPLTALPEPEESLDEQLEKAVEEKFEEVKKVEIQTAPSGQVVEITQPALEVRPDNARYVSEYDSKVDRETVARGTTEEMVNRPGPREAPIGEQNVPPEPEPGDPGAPGDKGLMSMRQPGLPDLPAIKNAGQRDGSDDRAGDGVAPRRGEGQLRDSQQGAAEQLPGEGGEGGDEVPDLRPTEELLSRVVGGGSVDKLDGVEDGETTALNSRRWKYASFFNRLKRQVAQNWHPDRVYVSRDPNGNVYGTKDRITILKVSLHSDGSVANIYISKASGVDFLDDEAIRAFHAAQPFPNPPGGLVSGDNLITFSFGFHFQIGSRRDAWKVFRYQ